METKYKHSVPVPQFYKESSKLLKKYLNKEGSLKSLIFQSGFRDFKKLLAVLSRVTEKYELIQEILKNIKVLEKEPNFNPHLAAVLTHEMIIKNDKLTGISKPVQVLNKYFEQIRKEYENIPISVESNTCESSHPKYGRINTLLISEEKFHQLLQEDNWNYIKYDKKITYEQFIDLAQKLNGYSYMADLHIKSLLLFPPNFPFWKTEMYKKNFIILQNKASCLPVFVSNLSPNKLVVDACAAPGNKTCHVAAILKNKGNIIAIDRDKKRFELLTRFLTERGVKNVKTVNADFTGYRTSENIHTIFVDPSCSNSGLLKDEIEKSRISKLSFFQCRILLHAFAFPTVETVIYSTCSILEDENEKVVSKALKEVGDRFELCDLSQKLRGWKNFGKSHYPFGSYCIRTSDDDLCHGFFIAMFKRKVSNNSEISNKKDKIKRKKKCIENADDIEDCVKKRKCN